MNLYFPEDKTEYIPGLIWLAIFVIGAIVATIWIVKYSRRKEREFQERYENEHIVYEDHDDPSREHDQK